jgi:hypothetical protein
MTSVVWRCYLGAGAVAAGVALVLPVAPRSVLLIAVSASAALAIVAGIRCHRPPARAAWWLLAAGQGLFVLGDVLFTVNDLILHIEPFPSLADALYLAGYPVLAGWRCWSGAARSRGTGRRCWTRRSSRPASA